MEDEINKIVYFAETDFRHQKKKFGIKRKDRSKHMYVVGKTGMGKTTLLENMAIQDIISGNGIGIIDPHGDFAEKMLDYIPEDRIKDVIYFNPVDMQNPVGFNVMEDVDEDQRHLVSAGLMGVFKKIWPDVWSARMEYILSNTVLALLEYPGSTLLGINRMLADKEYRKKVVDNIKDEVVKSFWTQEFARYTERFTQEATPAIQNKIGQFVTNPLMRNIVGQEKSTFNIREIMDKKKILIMNLSKGRIGEGNSHLLGAMLVTKIYLAAMSRVDIPEDEREPFYLYVDEFQNFATDAFASILSEARKYALSLIIAHQYIGQLVTETSTRVRDAVFGNVGTTITFRVGAADAEFLEKEFAPEFTTQELVNLPFARIYLRLMIDGVASAPFSALTLPPIEKAATSFRDKIIKASSDKYGTPISEVKEKISSGLAPVVDVGSDGEKSSGKKEWAQKFEATCTVCGKKTFVPFQPDGKRPVYCEEHRKNPPLVEVPKISLKKEPPKNPELTHVAKKEKKSFPPLNRNSNIREGSDNQRPTFEKRVPNIKEGDLVMRRSEEEKNSISLKDLKPKKTFAEKKSPDINALRNVLKASLEDDEDERGKDKKKESTSTLNPGDSIKF